MITRLNFSLTVILAEISGILLEGKIGIFILNTDYVFAKEEKFENALKLLQSNGYIVG